MSQTILGALKLSTNTGQAAFDNEKSEENRNQCVSFPTDEGQTEECGISVWQK